MESFSTAILIIFITTCVISILWLLSRFRSSLQSPYPPGPRGLPILGYLPFLRSDLHKQFGELATQYGPIFKIWLGSKVWVVISSPSLIKEVVRDHDIVFSNRDNSVATVIITRGIDLVWSPYGPYWRGLRKRLVIEMLSNDNLMATYSLRNDETRKLVRKIDAKIGDVVDIGEMIFETEMDLMMNMLWGGGMTDKQKSDQIGDEFREVAFKLSGLIGKPNVSDLFPILAMFDFQGIAKEMKVVVSRFDKIFDFVINERKKMMENGENPLQDNKKDFLQILMELHKDKDPERSITIPQIKAILLDILFGGTDTTATTIEWVMAELMKNPEIMKRAQQELANVIGINNTPEEHHIPKLQYLEAIVKETLRLHPTAPFLLPKTPSKSCNIGGFTVPKGCRVLLNMWSVHLDSQFWDDPFEFKPERFMNDPEKFDYIGSNFEYLPFGSGRRVCPGILLARKMMMHLLANLLHSFDWKLPEGEPLDITEKFDPVMRIGKPLFVIPFHKD